LQEFEEFKERSQNLEFKRQEVVAVPVEPLGAVSHG
jgi:hypothetical protein